MRDYALRVLPVVASSRDARLVGIIYRRNLLEVSSTRLPHSVSLIAEQPRLEAYPDANVWLVLREMLGLDEWYVPIVKSGGDRTYLGVLGLENIIEVVVDRDREVLEKSPIERYMTRDIVSIKFTEPVRRAWQLMLSKRLGALPVVDAKNRLIGVVAEYDLLKYGYSRPRLESDNWISRGPSVREIMSTPPVALSPDSSLLEAAEIMIDRNIGRVYVVDGRGELMGVVDREDVVRAYMRLRGMVV